MICQISILFLLISKVTRTVIPQLFIMYFSLAAWSLEKRALKSHRSLLKSTENSILSLDQCRVIHENLKLLFGISSEIWFRSILQVILGLSTSIRDSMLTKLQLYLSHILVKLNYLLVLQWISWLSFGIQLLPHMLWMILKMLPMFS